MPEKVYGTPVPFTDYAWRPLSDIIAVGLTIGVRGLQPVERLVDDWTRNEFANADLTELATSILTNASMTVHYIRISWNEYDGGVDEGGNHLYSIRDLDIGVVATTVSASTPNGIIDAMGYVQYYNNFVLNSIPQENWTAYELDPCPDGYHWDASSSKCTRDACPTGYHWDPDTLSCVKDTSTNCPAGTHWNSTQNRCVPNVVPQPDGAAFPWVPVLVGVAAVSALALGGYYLYKRSKRRKPPPPPMQNTLSMQ